MRRLIVAALALAVLGCGWYGTWSYAHDYYLYRGFPVLHDPPGIAHGRLVTFKIWSPALHKRKAVLVYLPPGYFRGVRQGRRYPALYLLQTSIGQAVNFMKVGDLGVRVDKLVHSHRIAPFITVMPTAHGADHEWANTPAGNYESYVLDVVHAVDKRFATIANRSGRAIAGLSEGAYGATNVALHNLRVFSQFESWSGYFVEARVFPFQNATAAELARNSPADYVPGLRAQLRRLPTRAFLYQGNRERPQYWGLLPSYVSQAQFAGELRAAGARVDTASYAGKHNWALWRGHMDHMLLWVGQNFRAAERGLKP